MSAYQLTYSLVGLLILCTWKKYDHLDRKSFVGTYRKFGVGFRSADINPLTSSFRKDSPANMWHAHLASGRSGPSLVALRLRLFSKHVVTICNQSTA